MDNQQRKSTVLTSVVIIVLIVSLVAAYLWFVGNVFVSQSSSAFSSPLISGAFILLNILILFVAARIVMYLTNL